MTKQERKKRDLLRRRAWRRESAKTAFEDIRRLCASYYKDALKPVTDTLIQDIWRTVNFAEIMVQRVEG